MKKKTSNRLKLIGVVAAVSSLMFFGGFALALGAGPSRSVTSVVSTITNTQIINGTTVTGTVVVQPEVLVSTVTITTGTSTVWVTVTNSTTITSTIP